MELLDTITQFAQDYHIVRYGVIIFIIGFAMVLIQNRPGK